MTPIQIGEVVTELTSEPAAGPTSAPTNAPTSPWTAQAQLAAAQAALAIDRERLCAEGLDA